MDEYNLLYDLDITFKGKVHFRDGSRVNKGGKGKILRNTWIGS